MSRKLLFLYYAIIWLSISSASILVRVSGAPGSVCAFWRLAFSVLLLTPPWIVQGNRSIDPMSVLSGVFLGLHFVFWMESLYLVPVVVSTVLVVTYPFYSLFFDYFLFGERVSRVQVAGLVVGFICVVLYYSPAAPGNLNALGLTYALVAGFLASLYFVIGRFLRSRRNVGLIDYVYPAYLSGLATTFAYNSLFATNLYSYSAYTYATFVLMSVVPMLGGHTLMNYLLKRVKTTTLTSIALGEPIGAGVLAYAFLNEAVSAVEVALSAAVLCSLFAIVYGETRAG